MYLVDMGGGYETWGYENFERSGRRPDRENLPKMGRRWFGARKKVGARSAVGLKRPKMKVFLDFRSQNDPKSELRDFEHGGTNMGGTKGTPKAAEGGRKKTTVDIARTLVRARCP